MKIQRYEKIKIIRAEAYLDPLIEFLELLGWIRPPKDLYSSEFSLCLKGSQGEVEDTFFWGP